jgi:hypothetical protein
MGFDIPTKITSEWLQRNYVNGNFRIDSYNDEGYVSITIPDFKKFSGGKIQVKVALTDLWKYCANLSQENIDLGKLDKEKITPENVSALILYGNVLYRNHPISREIAKKKYGIFGGPTVIVESKVSRKKPKSLDVMVLSKNLNGSLVIPKKAFIKFNKDDNRRDQTEKIDLNIIYKTINELSSGFEEDDPICVDAIRNGVVLCGEEDFEKQIQGACPQKQIRKPLHGAQWLTHNYIKVEIV